MSAPFSVPFVRSGLDISRDPRTGAAHPGVPHTPAAEVARVVVAAAGSAPLVGSTAPAVRAKWLQSIAASLDEHTKAAVSLRFYGEVAADGAYLQAVIDTTSSPAPFDL